MNEARDITLKEYVDELPPQHDARKEYLELKSGIDKYKDYFIHLLQSMNEGTWVKNPVDHLKDCMFVVAMRLSEGDLELAKKIKDVAKDPMEVRKLL